MPSECTIGHADDVEARARIERGVCMRTDLLDEILRRLEGPLTGIVGYAEVGLDSSASATDMRSCMTAIRENGQLLHDILHDVILIADLERETTHPEGISWALSDLCADCVATAAEVARGRGVRLTHRCGVDPAVSIVTEPRRFRTLILTVLREGISRMNASAVTLRASPHGNCDECGGVRTALSVTVTGDASCNEERASSHIDTMSRRLAQALAESLGAEMTIDGRTGTGAWATMRVCNEGCALRPMKRSAA